MVILISGQLALSTCAFKDSLGKCNRGRDAIATHLVFGKFFVLVNIFLVFAHWLHSHSCSYMFCIFFSYFLLWCFFYRLLRLFQLVADSHTIAITNKFWEVAVQRIVGE